MRVLGIAELHGWVFGCREKHTGHEAEDMLQAHLERGIREVSWHCARSTVFYHSDLPDATLYQGDTRPESQGLDEVYPCRCGLRAALRFAEAHGMTVWGRMAMNRHYSPQAYGGAFTSAFATRHPEWYEIGWEGEADSSRLCYAIPEVRQERIAILCEIAQLGVHGLQLDFCRQPPMARYHPAVVDAYRKETGQDPREINPLDRSTCLEWWRFRAQFVTQFLQELKTALDPLRRKTGWPIPVQARMTDCGVDINLAAGLDVVAWCEDGLIDELCVNPLQWVVEAIVHDVTPYVQLGRQTGVRVLGGAHTNCAAGMDEGARGINPLVLARRVLDLHEKGAEGVVLYETEYGVLLNELKEVLPILEDPEALADWVTDEGHIARWPITYQNAFYGIDNHSALGGGFRIWTPGTPRL